MTNKSWLVTLTPLIMAILTIVFAKLEERPITPTELEQIKIELVAFLGSGFIGFLVKRFKK